MPDDYEGLGTAERAERALGRFVPERKWPIPSNNGPIRKAKLAEQLYRYLGDIIQSGKLPAGIKFPTEKQLCDRFRVSRPVVREALAQLRTDGLIVSRRGSGSFISNGREPPPVLLGVPFERSAAPFGRKSKLADLLRCFELRMSIECDAAYYAALRREDKHLEAMVVAIAEIEQAMRTQSLDHCANFRFHMLIAEASGNSFFVNALHLLERHLEVCLNLLRDMWLIRPGEPLNVGKNDHSNILCAVRDRRADDASRAMFLHIDEARNEIFGELAPSWPGRMYDTRSSNRRRVPA